MGTAQQSDMPLSVVPAGRFTGAVVSRLNVLGRCLLLPALLFRALTSLSKSKRLGEFGTGLGVVRRDHRIVRTETPLLAVLFRGEALSAKVPLQRLVSPPVFET